MKTFAQFAELAGVNRNSVYQLRKNRLKLAVKKKAGRYVIDIRHPVAQEYLQEKKVQIREGTKRHPTHRIKYNKKERLENLEQERIDRDKENLLNAIRQYGGDISTVENFEEMTIREIALRFGGAPGLKSYADALRSLQDYKNKEMTWQQKRRELIKRKPVAESLFFIVNVAFKRLVEEYPESVASQLIAIIKSDIENVRGEVIRQIRNDISKILKDCKRSLEARIKVIEKAD